MDALNMELEPTMGVRVKGLASPFAVALDVSLITTVVVKTARVWLGDLRSGCARRGFEIKLGGENSFVVCGG